MKFSLNFEEYRDDLAKKIQEEKQESPEDARKLLHKEQKKGEYIAAKNLKKYQHLLSEKEFVETESDNFAIEVTNINDKIPSDIQAFIDRYRLIAAWENEIFSHYAKKYSWEWAFNNKPSLDEAIREGICPKEIKKLYYKGKEEEKIVQKAKDFINEVTEGDLYNGEKLNTVVDGFGREKETKYLGERREFDISEELSVPVWFATKDTEFYSPGKVLVITQDPLSKSFLKEFVSSIDRGSERNSPASWGDFRHGQNPELYEKEKDRVMKQVVTEMQPNFVETPEGGYNPRISGFRVRFKKGTRWMDIAEWIVDLPQGKLYKIKQKEKRK